MDSCLVDAHPYEKIRRCLTIQLSSFMVNRPAWRWAHPFTDPMSARPPFTEGVWRDCQYLCCVCSAERHSETSRKRRPEH